MNLLLFYILLMLFLLHLITIAFWSLLSFILFLEMAHQILIIYTTVDTICSALHSNAQQLTANCV